MTARLLPHERRRTYKPRGELELLAPASPPRPPAGPRPCIGCGRARVRGLHDCATCKARLRVGHPVDLDAYPTRIDARRIGWSP